jgi:hypothetical protein
MASAGAPAKTISQVRAASTSASSVADDLGKGELAGPAGLGTGEFGEFLAEPGVQPVHCQARRRRDEVGRHGQPCATPPLHGQ